MVKLSEIESIDLDTQETEYPKLLIVDDQPANLFAFEKTLRKLDVDIFKAQSGKEALSLMLRHQFALVLLDVQMPEMDGFETATLMKDVDELKYIPIVFVTAINKEERHVARGYATGAVDYLFKPIDPTILISKVKVFLELHEQQRHLSVLLNKVVISNKELEEFAYVASHDLQAPLKTIEACLNMLTQKYGNELSDEANKLIKFSMGNSNRMISLIKGLLAYSKITKDSKSFSKEDVNELMTLTLENLYEDINNSKANIIYGSLPVIIGNRVQLLQLFQNLINNAIKYQKENLKPQIKIEVNNLKDFWQFTIEDNGVGISREDHEKVFMMFHRLNSHDSHGSGIGLSTCKKIIECHQGEIWIESEINKGTKVFFTIKKPLDNL